MMFSRRRESWVLEETAQRLVSSAGAASASQVWRLLITFLTHMALRRLIPPAEMGPWVWAEPLFLILAQVRDLGIPGHLVREKDRAYGNFFRLQVTWGVAFTALVFFGAPWLASFYQDPSAPIIAVIRALCIFLLVQGLSAVPLIYLEAELLVARTIPAELVRNAVFAILSLALAWQGYGLWSLVIGHIAGSVVFGAMLWWAVRGRLELRLTAGSKRLVWVSLPLMTLAMLEMAVLKLDAFVLALRFPSEVVGIAGLAIYAVFFFPRLLADSIGRALYPALVRYGPERSFEAFRAATVFLAALAVPMAFFLFVNAELAALFLGGEKWLGAADYLRILSLVPLVRPLSMFGLELLLTRHMDRLLILYTLVNFLSLGGLGLYLTTTDLAANGMAVAGYFPLGLLFLTWGIYRMDPGGLGKLLLDLVEIYALAAVLFLPIFLWAPPVMWLRAILSGLAGLVVLAYSLWRFGAFYRSFLAGDAEADA